MIAWLGSAAALLYLVLIVAAISTHKMRKQEPLMLAIIAGIIACITNLVLYLTS